LFSTYLDIHKVILGPYYKSVLEQDVELKLGSDMKMIF